MKSAIGIDLGTSTSEICVYRLEERIVVPDPHNPGRSPIVPSLVVMSPSGEPTVGHAARGNVDRPNFGVREVKRMMGTGERVVLQGRDYAPEQISAHILRKLKANAEEFLGEPVTDVVISVPANFADAPKAATMAAGRMAGLNVLRLIAEPTAAALAYGISRLDANEQVMVFDLGGGTLDISILEMSEGVLDVKCSYGDSQLGGKDFDDVVADLITAKLAADRPEAQISEKSRRQLKSIAEEAKISLSRQDSAMVYQPSFATVAGEPVDLELVLYREELERAAEPLLIRIRACIRQALAAKAIEPREIDQILLVGGATHMPCVRQVVREEIGREPAKTAVDPDLAVATGAAIQAALATNLIVAEKAPILVDVSPFGLGIQLRGSSDSELLYEPLIAPNTAVPYMVEREYRLVEIGQKSARVVLLQDHLGRARLAEEAVDTGISALIENIPPAPGETPHAIAIRFSYDISHLLKIRAHLPATGQWAELKCDKSFKRISEEEIAIGTAEVERWWSKSERASPYDAILDRAARWSDEAPPDDRPRIREAIGRLRDALQSGDESRIQAAIETLSGLLPDQQR